MKVQLGKTYLIVPHERKEIAFQHPPFKGNHGNVASQIDEAGLLRPTSMQTASLVYDAWKNLNGEYEEQIIQILKNAWLLEFTGNLYLPKSNEEINNGVILEDNPTIENGKLVMNKDSLVKRLKQGDKKVRFVPFGFKTGIQNLLDFQKNPYIVARYGEEGAEKIAEVASRYKSNPRIFSFNSVNEETTRMSALNRSWDFDGRLYVDGDDWDGNWCGRAFGVVPSDDTKK